MHKKTGRSLSPRPVPMTIPYAATELSEEELEEVELCELELEELVELSLLELEEPVSEEAEEPSSLEEELLSESALASSGKGVPSARKAPLANNAAWVDGSAIPVASKPLATWKLLIQLAVVAP